MLDSSLSWIVLISVTELYRADALLLNKDCAKDLVKNEGPWECTQCAEGAVRAPTVHGMQAHTHRAEGHFCRYHGQEGKSFQPAAGHGDGHSVWGAHLSARVGNRIGQGHILLTKLASHEIETMSLNCIVPMHCCLTRTARKTLSSMKVPGSALNAQSIL
jgi:hypothetical protein